MHRLTKDLKHYSPLFGVLLAGLLGILIFSYDKPFQMAIVLATATAYVSWGLVHHFLHKDLHISVILEYLVIAIFGVVVVYSLIFQA